MLLQAMAIDAAAVADEVATAAAAAAAAAAADVAADWHDVNYPRYYGQQHWHD